MKRLLGVAAAIGGLFMGGSTGPVELDYISYDGAAISGYAGSPYLGAFHPILPEDSGAQAEFIEPDPEHGFTGLTGVSSAAASESAHAMEQPLRASVRNAYEPRSLFASTSSMTDSFPVGGPLLGETGVGHGGDGKAKAEANEPAAKNSAATLRRTAARTIHRSSTTRREAGCARCSGSQWSSHPKILIAWSPKNLFRRNARMQQEHSPAGAAREQEPRMLAALSL